MTRTATNTKTVISEVARLRCVGTMTDSHVKEMADLCLSRFDTLEAVHRCIGNFVLNADHVPRPKEIVEYATQHDARTFPACDLCEGEGWVMVHRHVSTLDGARTIEAAERCRCRPPVPHDTEPTTQPMHPKRQQDDLVPVTAESLRADGCHALAEMLERQEQGGGG